LQGPGAQAEHAVMGAGRDLGFGATIGTGEDLAALYGPPSEPVRRKVIDRLDDHCRDFVGRSPLVLLATSDARGRCDLSPRGGPPGFVAVLDEHRLLLADAPGNRRIDSLRNVLENPSAGLLFLVPGIGETLRVNGRAALVSDAGLLAAHPLGGATPKVAIGVRVEEAYLHCAKALRRSSLWDPAGWPALDDWAGAARVLRDHIALPAATEQAVRRFLDDDYANHLY
jgi:PPOX class probable FMN-dependent enzyme